jgi:hypothetical protein
MPVVKRKERPRAVPAELAKPVAVWGPALFGAPGPKVLRGPGGTLWPVHGHER